MGTVTVTVTEVGGNTAKAVRELPAYPHFFSTVSVFHTDFVVRSLGNVVVVVLKWRVILLRSIRPSYFAPLGAWRPTGSYVTMVVVHLSYNLT